MKTVWLGVVGAALLGALVSCGDTSVKEPAGEVTVNVTEQDGSAFSYTTRVDFRPTLKPVSELSADEAALLTALNGERARGGSCTDPQGKVHVYAKTGELSLEANIYVAAQGHAQAMVNGNFASHVNTSDISLRTPMRRMVKAGYRPVAPAQGKGELYFEESLAFGQLTAAEVVQAWKTESFLHCRAIYIPLNYGAVTVVNGRAGNQYGRYWVLNTSGVIMN
ncbi:hypothetical protein [Deinococcus depolymerans]|uniref:CAP domain-containing protein n=1 Tax=Deinococcus depolymerans TaxID=392408 RepID=UPI00309FF3F1